MARLIPQPETLIQRASHADADHACVTLTADEARGIAEMWHADREKIRYLESLITHMARGGSACCVLTAVNAEQRERIVNEIRRAAGLEGLPEC